MYERFLGSPGFFSHVMAFILVGKIGTWRYSVGSCYIYLVNAVSYSSVGRDGWDVGGVEACSGRVWSGCRCMPQWLCGCGHPAPPQCPFLSQVKDQQLAGLAQSLAGGLHGTVCWLLLGVVSSLSTERSDRPATRETETREDLSLALEVPAHGEKDRHPLCVLSEKLSLRSLGIELHHRVCMLGFLGLACDTVSCSETVFLGCQHCVSGHCEGKK